MEAYAAALVTLLLPSLACHEVSLPSRTTALIFHATLSYGHAEG